MGFSGGGSNVLKPHKHDGTVVQDGGSLDFDNITQADLTAGDVIFSNGTHLQRLAIGTPAQQIKVNAGATAPEYFTPSAGGISTTRTVTSTTTEQSTTSLTAVAVSGAVHTLAAGAGTAVCWYGSAVESNNQSFWQWDFATDGTLPLLTIYNMNLGATITGISSTLSGQVAQLEFGMRAAGTVYVQRDTWQGSMVIMEFS